MGVLWPWRKGRLKWVRGVGGVMMSASADYVVEAAEFTLGGEEAWRADIYVSGRPRVLCFRGSRSLAMRACEVHEMSLK